MSVIKIALTMQITIQTSIIGVAVGLFKVNLCKHLFGLSIAFFHVFGSCIVIYVYLLIGFTLIFPIDSMKPSKSHFLPS